MTITLEGLLAIAFFLGVSFVSTVEILVMVSGMLFGYYFRKYRTK